MKIKSKSVSGYLSCHITSNNSKNSEDVSEWEDVDMLDGYAPASGTKYVFIVEFFHSQLCFPLDFSALNICLASVLLLSI